MYTSFIPKIFRDWNDNIANWRALVDWAPSIDSFKSRYKKVLFNKCFLNNQDDNMKIDLFLYGTNDTLNESGD